MSHSIIPTDHAQFFVQGGSSAVGLYTIQLAKAIGFKVATTCSPHSYDLVKSYGADFTADYHDPTKAAQEVVKASGGGVVGALDCIGGKEGTQISAEAFGDKSGHVTTLLPPPEGYATDKVKFTNILLYMVGGYVSLSSVLLCFDRSKSRAMAKQPLCAPGRRRCR